MRQACSILGLLAAASLGACGGPAWPVAAGASSPRSDDPRASACAAPLVGPLRSSLADRAAVDPRLAGVKITKVRVDGVKYVAPALVLPLLSVREGDVVEVAKLAADARHVDALGVFDELAWKSEPDGTLVLAVREAPLIRNVYYLEGEETSRAFGFAPQRGDLYDPPALARMAEGLRRHWVMLENPSPSVEVRARAYGDGVDLCLRASGGAGSNATELAHAAEEVRAVYVKEAAASGKPQYDDEELGRYVSTVGDRVAVAAGYKAGDLHFVVTDVGRVNANSSPDRIWITRGMLAALNTEAQLAALLGHEIAHASLHHPIYEVLERAEASGEGTAETPFGRYAQTQADRAAAMYLERLGYDPHELLTMLSILLLTNMLADEPTSMDSMFSRLVRAERVLAGRSGGRLEAEAYAAATDGVVWGPAGSRERVRYRGISSVRSLESALASTCPAGPDPGLLRAINESAADRVDPGSKVKCIVTE